MPNQQQQKEKNGCQSKKMGGTTGAGKRSRQNNALAPISGNVPKAGAAPPAKRTIEDFFGFSAKRQRQGDALRTIPPPTPPSSSQPAALPPSESYTLNPWSRAEEALGEEETSTDLEVVQIVEAELAPASVDVAQPKVDEFGWIRVGGQPIAAHYRDIRSAPLSYVDVVLKSKVDTNSKVSDAKGNGFVKRLCDYTGMEVIWTPSPRSMSLEAAYPFSSQNGSLRYHASPNGHFIMSAMNLAKSGYPIAVLPLVSVILNADQKPTVTARQSEISWAFNALCNATTLHTSFGTSIPNKTTRFEKWGAWSSGQQRDVLEALRTVEMTPFVLETLSGKAPQDLFRVRGNLAPTPSPTASEVRDRQYPVLLQIAASYGLDQDDFEFYLTIPSSRPHIRLFYPFHVLSRPQAQAIGWDWHHLDAIAIKMLEVLRRYCNRHAEAQCCGDKSMDGRKLVCWMAAHFSRQVQTLKREWPAATREEIRFRIVNRWGLPIVPWVGNPLHASLCKGPDQGIAMKFGLVEPTGFELFNPVRHIDLSKCTITIDAVITNMTMYNYQRESWGSIRSTLAAVPLRHPLWRIADSAGMYIWSGEFDRTTPPVAPIPGFDVALTAIDAWFSGVPLTPRCDQCGIGFTSLGSLVQHCRSAHSGSTPAATDLPVNSNHDAIDEAYWEDRLTCPWPGCQKSFPRIRDLSI